MADAVTASDTAPITAPPDTAATADTPSAAPSTAPEPKPEIRRFKVKVDGQELEVDEGELLKGYQRASAANRRFEEAVKARQEAERIREEISKDWRGSLKKAGLDPRELAKQEILQAIEEEKRAQEEANLPQEVRAQLEQARKEREELAKLKAEREADSKNQLDAEAKRHFEAFNQQLPKVMEAAHLPRTAEAARMVIAKAQAMIKAGVPLDLETAAQAAAEELSGRNFAILRSMSPADIVRAIGEDAYKALLKHSVEQVRGKQLEPPPKPATTTQDRPARTAMTAREWDKEFGAGRR